MCNLHHFVDLFIYFLERSERRKAFCLQPWRKLHGVPIEGALGLSSGWQPVHIYIGSGIRPKLGSFKLKIWILRYLRIIDMQLLILKASSIIWGVGKSLNWNHMKKHLEKNFSQSAARKMTLVGGGGTTNKKWKDNLSCKDW